LSQSERWSASFKEEIKKLMEEITNKNEQIAKIRRSNIDMNSQIQKNQCELKSIFEEKQRNAYKRDKLQIKVEELESRIKVY
jgi:superfamily II RNA helicase